MSIALFAADARPKSALTIRSLESGDIRVVIDGRRFESNKSSMMIRDLEPGYHQVKVYRERSNGRFNIFGRRYEVVYNASLMVKPRTHVRISIDRLGRASVDERRTHKSGRDVRDWDGDRNQDRNDDWDGRDDYEFGRGGKFGDYDTNYGFERGMDDREFRQLLSSIDKEWLETNKLKSATHVVRTSNLTSAQVKQLVLLFNFENNKLELAKQAYQTTVDKRNYYIINDAFSFNSSREELARFTRTIR
jgi:hypothetical protein